MYLCLLGPSTPSSPSNTHMMGLLQENADVQRMLKLLEAMETRDDLAILTLLSSCICPITWCLFPKHCLSSSECSTARLPSLTVMQQAAALQMLVKFRAGECTQQFPDGKMPLQQMTQQLLFLWPEQPAPCAEMRALLRVPRLL